MEQRPLALDEHDVVASAHIREHRLEVAGYEVNGYRIDDAPCSTNEKARLACRQPVTANPAPHGAEWTQTVAVVFPMLCDVPTVSSVGVAKVRPPR